MTEVENHGLETNRELMRTPGSLRMEEDEVGND